MRANQMMSRHVITIGVDAPLVDAINTMLKHGVSGLPVVDEAGKLVGILSKSDFLRRAEIGTERRRGRLLTFLAGPDRVAFDFKREHGRKVGEIMTPEPATITEDTPVEVIARIMESRRVRRLPVLNGDKIVGIVTDFGLSARDRTPCSQCPTLCARRRETSLCRRRRDNEHSLDALRAQRQC